MNYNIRNTDSKDFLDTVNLTRETFWNLYKSGCDEHLVLHNLRKSDDYIPELDFVIESDNQIIGNIVYSKANILDESKGIIPVIVLGPVTVHPDYQGSGLGSKLIIHTLEIAKALGYIAVFLYGSPHYYPRFGFENAEKYGVTTLDGANFDPFMCCELMPNSLEGIHGKLMESKVFLVNEQELLEFEKGFPYKEKGEPKIKI
ncbi:MAG: N-acetyltransferase [Candidatus Absconditabacteria bacterium]